MRQKPRALFPSPVLGFAGSLRSFIGLRPPLGDLFEKGNTYLGIVSCGGEGRARPALWETALAEHDPFLGSAMVFPAYDAIRDQATLMRLTRELNLPTQRDRIIPLLSAIQNPAEADACSRALLSFSNSVTCKRRTSN